MTGSVLATAVLWSYGLAAAGFLVFAIRLAVGWRRNARGALLILAIVATALWAAAGMCIPVVPGPWAWLATNVFDALRYATWFAFLASLLLELAARGLDSPRPMAAGSGNGRCRHRAGRKCRPFE